MFFKIHFYSHKIPIVGITLATFDEFGMLCLYFNILKLISDFPIDYFFDPFIGYLGMCLISTYLWAFQISFLLVICFIPLWLKNILCIISVFGNLFVLWLR
jgi:hypothetical protein